MLKVGTHGSCVRGNVFEIVDNVVSALRARPRVAAMVLLTMGLWERKRSGLGFGEGYGVGEYLSMLRSVLNVYAFCRNRPMEIIRVIHVL